MTVDELQRPMRILLVEDNPADVRLVREALKGKPIQLSIVANGEEALAFLRHEGPYTAAVRPDMILLDLNLPRKSGLEVLATIKEDTELRSIPVLVLTNSNLPQDIAKSYQLHANGYIHKPVELERFFAVMQEIERFWGTVVTLHAE